MPEAASIRRFRIIAAAAAVASAAGAVLVRINCPEVSVTAARPFPWQNAVHQWLPAALGINAGLLLIASWLAPLILRPASGPRPLPPAVPLPRFLSPLVLGTIMLAAGLLNGPRLEQSLWLDEEFSMRHFILGEYKTQGGTAEADPGKLRWHPVTWAEVFYDYHTPNNHGLSSFLSRVAHGRPARSPEEGMPWFKEWRLRLPAFAAALLSIPALWLLMRRLGFGAASLAAPAFLALHPWFVRYSTEARAYGLLLLLWPLAVLCAVEAVRTSRWRWWIGLSVVQALMMWAWMMQIYWLVPLNLTILLLIRKQSAQDRKVTVVRWLTAGLLAVALALPLILPGFVQVSAWAAQERAAGGTGSGRMWLADAGSILTSGEPWISPDSANPLCAARGDQVESAPSATAAQIGGPALLFAAGMVVWIMGRHRALLAAMLLPPVLMYLHSQAKGTLLIPWYAACLVPAAAMLAGAAAEKLTARLTGIGGIAAALLIVAAASWPGSAMRSRLRGNEIEPNLPATLLTRRNLNPGSPGAGSEAITIQPTQPRPAYDPFLRTATDPASLRKFMDASVRRGVPLFIHLGDAPFARMRMPSLMALVDDPRFFTPIAVLHGMDHAQSRFVWKWTGVLP